ncbi:PAS domain S-box protein [Methanoplanus sp. FWC-SCC4]|uniref:histidine kinase n=1 Tax=Methanochimaera problematica TaxID=2609417 RepID=A0AA97FEP7_9EURY|nr:histidine kinase dimerization/phosphoacceptor domain -containing protein [Methanoplanus sp. FWC-SCC4]WOF17177.1 PAS domain S-box protein [Methanoplanus sp. FWC-SCC4]
MDKNQDNHKNQFSYKNYLFIVIFLISLIIIISSVFYGFISASDLVIAQAEESQNELTSKISDDIGIINKGLEIYDTSLNNRLERCFIPFLEEYEKSGRDPAKMDLESVKSATGEDVTLYIINSSYVIEESTNPTSIGLDFKKFAAYYIDYLEKIRFSNDFFAERALTEIETGMVKKFGYLGTPDNRYILEISLFDEEFDKLRKELKYSDHIERVTEKNPYVTDIKIYNSIFHEVGNKNFKADSRFEAFLSSIFEKETSVDITDEKTGKLTRYLYIPLKSEDYGSDNSLVVKLDLTTGPMSEMLSDIFLQYVGIGIFAVMICFGSAFLISQHFGDEVKDIVKDIEKISKGDLDHKIKNTPNREFKNLEESINDMVANLRKNIDEVNESRKIVTMERDRARKYFDFASVIFIAVTKKGDIIKFNHRAEEALGYSNSESAGYNFYDLILTENNRNFVRALLLFDIDSDRDEPRYFQCKVKTKTGTIRDINFSSVILRDENSDISGFLITGEDITNELKSKKDLQSSLHEKNALLKEVHHRVKNNLQVINSLLELQSGNISDEYILSLFRESESRVNSMALVHEIMYDSGNFSRINIADYTRSLVLETLSGKKGFLRINVDFILDDIFFDLDHAVPYGLLINEMTSNAVKHAFKGKSEGNITVKLRKKDNGNIILEFRDNGTGIPDEETLYASKGIGLSLIKGLTRQLKGEISIERESGTKYTIEMEKPEEQIRF